MSRCISYWKMVDFPASYVSFREDNSPFTFLIFVWFTFPIFRFTFGLDMLKTAFKSSLREVEGVFRLFNSRKDLFMNHLSGPKGPQFPESANLFHDHRSTSINYKTIHVQPQPPPQKKTTSRYPIFSRLSPFFFFHFFASLHKKSSNEQTNNTTSRHPLHHRQTHWFFTIASPHIVTMTLTRLSHLLPWNFQGDH